MSADALLARLERVRRTGAETHIASCPGPHHANGDRHPSLRVRETDQGVILLYCFSGGCSPTEIVGAVGLELSDLFPSRSTADHVGGIRRPFLPSDVFEIARQEIGVVAIVAADLHKQREVSESDYERLFVAVERLNNISRAAYAR